MRSNGHFFRYIGKRDLHVDRIRYLASDGASRHLYGPDKGEPSYFVVTLTNPSNDKEVKLKVLSVDEARTLYEGMPNKYAPFDE